MADPARESDPMLEEAKEVITARGRDTHRLGPKLPDRADLRPGRDLHVEGAATGKASTAAAARSMTTRLSSTSGVGVERPWNITMACVITTAAR